MIAYLKLLLLFAIGTIAGFINVNAGGGSSITLSTLIFLGLNSASANGTNRIGLLFQNILAVSSFHKQKIHQFRKSFILAIFTLPGAIIGAILSIRITDEWFHRILAIVMIGIVFTIIFSPSKHSTSSAKVVHNKWLIYPAMFGIGFYGGFIQVGVGFLLMASLYHILKISLVQVNMHKVFIILLYTIPALYVFTKTGNVNWLYGLILAGGTSFGGWWGVKLAIKGGEKVIRYILIIAILVMALKLLGVF